MACLSSSSWKLLQRYERSNTIIRHKQSKYCIRVINKWFPCAMMMWNEMPEAAHQNSACNQTCLCKLPTTLVHHLN